MENRQLIDDLKATKERIQKVGWCGTGPFDNQGRECVMVAAQSVMGLRIGSSLSDEVLKRYNGLAAALAQHLPGNTGLIGPWTAGEVGDYSDDPLTQWSDIETLIDKALAEAGGLG